MELSDVKTFITHSNNYARFLGYDVRVRREAKIKQRSDNITQRSLNNKAELNMPLNDKIHQFLFSKGIVLQGNDGILYPTHRPYLERFTDLEIVSTYNAELRGICNFYSMASNFNKLNYFASLNPQGGSQPERFRGEC